MSQDAHRSVVRVLAALFEPVTKKQKTEEEDKTNAIQVNSTSTPGTAKKKSGKGSSLPARGDSWRHKGRFCAAIS